jgi:predicted RND superfamily exporter protein
MGFVHRRLLIGVLAVARRPRTTLLIAAAALLLCILATVSTLTISTDQNQLFSGKVPFFRDYLSFIKEFPENEAVYIVIEPKDPATQPPLHRWTAVADEVTARLQSLTDTVRLAECKVPLEELGRQGILFEDPAKLPAELEQARQFVPLAQFWGEKADLATGLLGNTPMERFLAGTAAHADAQTAQFVKLLSDSWIDVLQHPDSRIAVGSTVPDLQRLSATDPLQLGYYYVPNELDRSQFRILVRVYPQPKHDSLTSVTQTVDTIRDNAVDAAKDFPEFTIGVTGRPALEADEMRATDIDSHHAEIAAIIGVFIGLVIFLRSFWLALAAEIALGVGIGWSFGWATLTVGQLNLLSLVFLIALIGIGMDYLVQILTRYRLEARRYQRPAAVWVRVFKHVGPPINTACCGAAGAFFVSIFTDFRGAANLGVIAGGGLILCLLAGYTVLPPLLTLFPPRLKPMDLGQRYAKKHRSSGLMRLILPGMWFVVLAAGGPYMQLAKFNPGLIELQVPHLQSVELISTLQTWMAVELSKDPNELERVRQAVTHLPTVASTESILNAGDNAKWLSEHAKDLPAIDWSAPNALTASDLNGLAAKARNLADHFAKWPDAAESLRNFSNLLVNSKTPVADAARLTQWQQVFIVELQDLLGKFNPSPLNLSALPKNLRSHYVSDDGVYALYIIPVNNLWVRSDLVDFVNEVEKAVGTVPGAAAPTGIAIDVAHTTHSIRNAFFQATFYALSLILILVFLDFRRLMPTLMAVSVLGLGLPMLLALMGYFGVDWNFANFFGLPILIGAGHEYGVFMVHRYLEAKKFPRRIWRRWDTSDRALLLCAYITSLSFGFFWLLARHQGLKSLGLVMTVGTACIYLSALIVLRPILRWGLDHHYRKLQIEALETADAMGK